MFHPPIFKSITLLSFLNGTTNPYASGNWCRHMPELPPKNQKPEPFTSINIHECSGFLSSGTPNCVRGVLSQSANIHQVYAAIETKYFFSRPSYIQIQLCLIIIHHFNLFLKYIFTSLLCYSFNPTVNSIM